jgi:hypothetical protein
LIAIEGGRIVADCSPGDFFGNEELVRRLKIDVPMPVKLSYELAACGLALDQIPISTSEFVVKWHETHH